MKWGKSLSTRGVKGEHAAQVCLCGMSVGKGAHRISVGEGLEEGLSDRVHLMYCDYRNCPGGFMGHRGVGRMVRGGKCGRGSVRQVL